MKNKGISLIVLIVTILVICIIATAIILNMTDTNVIANAELATEKNRSSEVESYISIWKAENLMGKYLNSSIKSEESLLNELKDKKLIYDEEIDTVNKVITIGGKKIAYASDSNISVGTQNSSNSESGNVSNPTNNTVNIINKMTIGWNLGNSLDTNTSKKGLTVEQYETDWHNPVTTNEMIKAIKNSGINTIRIPVTWYNHLDEQNKIDEVWMNRVKEIVDYVANNDMIAILNVHHDDKLLGLEKDKATFANVINKYKTVWEQIANTFKNYNENLVFEIINEPRVILEDGSSVWAPDEDLPYENLNDFCNKMLQTIRSTGGNNSNRLVLIPTFGTLTTKAVLQKLRLPNDNNIGLSVHGYIPYEYCHDTTVAYTDDMCEDMMYKVKTLGEYSKQNNIPIVMTELGCYEKSDRNEWIKNIYTYSEYYGIKLVWWDNGDEYKIFDRQTLKVTDASAVNTMKISSENGKNFKNNTSINLVNSINTTSNVSTNNDNMVVNTVDGKNHYFVNATLTDSCRFKFADVYEINNEYSFFEFSYKVKTDMKEAKIKLVINFMDENDNVIYKVDYDNISKEIDGTKSIYEIKKMYRVKGAKKVQIERFSISPYTDEGQVVNLEMYDVKLTGM